MKLIDAIKGYSKSIQVFAAGKGLTSEEVKAAYAKASTDEEKKAIVSANAMQICKEIFVVKGRFDDKQVRSTFIKIFESNARAIEQTIHHSVAIVMKAIKMDKIEDLGKAIFNRGSVSYFLIDTIKRFFAAYPDRIMKEAFGVAEPAAPAPAAPVEKKAPAKKKTPKKEPKKAS